MSISDTLRRTSRLFVAADLGAGTTLAVSADQAHYLQHVMRLKTGDVLRLFNGRDGEWHGSIGVASKRATEIITHKQIRPQNVEPDIWLCCGPIKKAHFDNMIEKATELGVAAIHPVLTAHTQIREVNVERCHAIAVEAAEQSERLKVPAIEKPVTLEKLISSWPRDRTLIVCAETGEAAPLQEAFKSPALKSAAKVAILTGPEGGFAAEELETLRKVPQAVFVRLGPRILRADTAAIAALSCWQALCGDWK